MIRVALTGGIGTGKTTVAKLFKLLDVPVYFSDIESKKLVVENNSVRQKVISAFGEQSYLPNNEYNIKYIASIVFSNKEKLNQLNSIIHPAVFEHQKQWFNSQTHSYAISESALLFETNNHINFDKIIVVQANDPIRIERIMKRDNSTKEQTQKRINSQFPQEEKVAKADYIIYNNSESLIKQVVELNNLLNNLLF